LEPHGTHHLLELLDPPSSDQLSEGQHDHVGLGFEAQGPTSLLQEVFGDVEGSSHTIHIIAYASGCQAWRKMSISPDPPELNGLSSTAGQRLPSAIVGVQRKLRIGLLL